MSKDVDLPGCDICAYCGVESPETRDHIPPRALFPAPLPADLITVPCCEECRQGWSRDDEYFRLALMSSANLSELPEAQPVVETVLRSLQRREARGLTGLASQSVVEIEHRTGAGVIAGTNPAFRLDRQRMDRVCERIVRGLFFKEYRRPLPPSHLVKTALQQFGLDHVWPLIEGVDFASLRSAAGNLFHYTFATVEEDSLSSLWLIDFYGRLPMIGFIYPALRYRILHARQGVIAPGDGQVAPAPVAEGRRHRGLTKGPGRYGESRYWWDL